MPVQLTDVSPESILVDLLDGLSEHALDNGGRAELKLGAYGYQCLRLRRPEDDPII